MWQVSDSISPDLDADPAPAERAWPLRLYQAIAERSPDLLRLAEQAVKDCPGEPLLLNLASLAALLEERPDRCLLYQKRVCKRFVPNQGDHLLRALALAQKGRHGQAAAILKRYGLNSTMAANSWLPAGWYLRPWLKQQLAKINAAERGAKTAPRTARRSASRTATATMIRPGFRCAPSSTSCPYYRASTSCSACRICTTSIPTGTRSRPSARC
jgi:hypothetical protein